MSERETVIFGAGINGERFMCQHFQDIQISCFWDNKKAGEILGYPIEKPQAGKNCYIIVASAFYLEIREQLIQMGYREFDDFIPHQIFGKKMAVVYGNCHMSAIRTYLEGHRAFASEYGFYPFPMIQIYKGMNDDFGEVFKHCNLFFHQSIRKDNAYGEQCASEYMLSRIPESCEVIAVPNLHRMPKYLFPQSQPVEWRTGRSFIPFPADVNILAWLKEGKSVDQIKKYVLEGGVYQKAEIIEMWETFVSKMEMREKEWDIKILDYILQNQVKQKLFCDINHIDSRTALEISNRILKYMGYNGELGCERALLDGSEVAVYADVVEALGLKFERKYIKKWEFGNAVYSYEMNEEEYVEQMVQYIHFHLSKGFIK